MKVLTLKVKVLTAYNGSSKLVNVWVSSCDSFFHLRPITSSQFIKQTFEIYYYLTFHNIEWHFYTVRLALLKLEFIQFLALSN